MRWLVLVMALWPSVVLAQSKTVKPEELVLSVSVDARETTPFVREMVMITIRGVYRRHITLETLIQPDFDGFSWAQLGADLWQEERLNGEKVKTFTRRMAIYPDRAGTLTIGTFRHDLTLTDETDDWFEHQIQSEPITLEVRPAPQADGWWFPVRRLRVSDDWSNAPDQLTPGEGVLRVVRIEALGVTPEMIPPMPDLTSPSAMIFPHPEKRLVELTPEGPLTYAFWRWTIRPSNDTSTIVEPLTFAYFDTVHRDAREVTISAQRVAYGTVTGPEPVAQTAETIREARLPSWFALGLAVVVFGAGMGLGLKGRRVVGLRALQRFPLVDPQAREVQRLARAGQAVETRRAAAALLDRDGPSEVRASLIAQLDRTIFDPEDRPMDLQGFARRFVHEAG